VRFLLDCRFFLNIKHPHAGIGGWKPL